MIELPTVTKKPRIELEATPTNDPPGGWGYQSLLIRQIRRDGGTQARVGTNEDTVQEYAELMREHAWDFQSRQRPIVLYDGESFWLADGFHRIEAAQRAGMSDFPVEVLRGTKRDAILRAAGANSQHGLRRTNADKRRAVELLLRDEEWRQWSDRKIADVCAVSDKTVGAIRRDLSAEIPQIQTRTVERNGTTYQMTPRPTVADRTNDAPIGTPNLLRGAINRADGSPLDNVPPPDLSPYGYSARWLPDGRLAIHTPGNLETEHTAGALNDLLQFWRSYPPIPTDLAAMGVAWCYRSDRMYQVENNGTPHHTGYTAAECLSAHRDYLGRTGQLVAPAAETDDSAIKAQIREKAAGYGLQLILEDGKALVYWEGEDVEAMELLPYPIILEWLENEAETAWERYRAANTLDAAPQVAPVALTITQLDDILPTDLFKAGYFWQSATPPTIAHNVGNWRGDAPTAEQAIGLAYDREKAKDKPQGCRLSLEFTPDECAAMLKEAKLFERIEGLTRRMPTISQTLVLMIEAIQATE